VPPGGVLPTQRRRNTAESGGQAPADSVDRPMMAIEIPAAINPYSIAVAPLSFRMNARTKDMGDSFVSQDHASRQNLRTRLRRLWFFIDLAGHTAGQRASKQAPDRKSANDGADSRDRTYASTLEGGTLPLSYIRIAIPITHRIRSFERFIRLVLTDPFE
jgi:hypothetical protein